EDWQRAFALGLCRSRRAVLTAEPTRQGVLCQIGTQTRQSQGLDGTRAQARARRVLHAHAGTAVRPPTLCCRVTPEGRDGACRLTGQQRVEPARYSFLPYSMDCAGTAGPKARSPCG